MTSLPSHPAASPADAQRPRPRSPTQLFWVCTSIALQGFGGVVAVVQRELVERHRWLTPAEFTEDWAVAQTLPGANVVNLTMMLGSRHFGLRGAIAAVAGMLLLPAILLIALAVLYGSVSDAPAMQGALRGVGAVAAGLILATGLKMAPTLRHSPLGLGLAALIALAAFVAVALLRVPLVWVLGTLGLLSCVLAHARLAANARTATPATAEAADATRAMPAAQAETTAPTANPHTDTHSGHRAAPGPNTGSAPHGPPNPPAPDSTHNALGDGPANDPKHSGASRNPH